jgi:hypothetical protein
MKNISNKLFEQTTTGGAVINTGGHVDLPAGIFDRPGPQNQAFSGSPIVPNNMVANQLAVVRPPIDDEEYRPNSKSELALSVSEISKTIPDSQISKFYQRVKELAQESIDAEHVEELDEKSKTEMSESSAVRHNLENFLKKIDANTMKKIREFSANECIDIMQHKGIITQKKGNELRKNVHVILKESLFKRFFVVSMINPAVSSVLKENRNYCMPSDILKKYSGLSVKQKIKIFESICE